MPAAVRGGSRVEAKPRAKAPLGPAKRPRGKAPGPGAAGRGSRAAKSHHGPSPSLIIAGTVALLAAALGVVLATGHRAERIAAAARHTVDRRFAEAGFRLRSVHIEGASPAATA